METFDLAALGWTPGFAQAFSVHEAAGLLPARVAAQDRSRYTVLAQSGTLPAQPSGRLRHTGERFPAVGDWVAIRPSGELALIEAVLPAANVFERADPDHGGRPEVVAANLDLVLVVVGADRDFNLRRLERFLAAAWASGAQPVVVLTKADLVDTPAEFVRQIESAAPGVPIHAISSRTGEGVPALRALIAPGRTASLLGSSGAGKSSLLNRILGSERQAVASLDATGRGRHTTTRRELVMLEGGGMIIDTPGMRQFNPMDNEGMGETFADLEALAGGCRFKDCSHSGEPGCAVAQAVASGAVAADRLAGWDKLKRELAHLERKDDPRADAEHRRRWRAIHKAGKARMKMKRPD